MVRPARPGAALVDDAQANDLVLADDAEARRIDQHDAAVDLGIATGGQDMQRRAQAERLGRRRGVMGEAVGDRDGAGDALGGHVGEAGRQGLEQAGAVIGPLRIAQLDDSRLDIRDAAQLPFDLRDGGIGLGRAVGETVRGRTVDHDRDDVLDRLAILENQRGIGQRRGQHHERQRAQDGAATGEDDGRAGSQSREHGKPDQQRQGHHRGEGDAPHGYCPRRSSRAGTWT
jgi:hypothetical protein